MIQKDPGNRERRSEMGCQCLDSERFGGVVPTVKHIDPEILGKCVGPVGAFAGDEGVHTLLGGDSQFVARSAGHHSDAATEVWTAWENGGTVAEYCGEPRFERVPSNRGSRLQADGLIALEEERFGLAESESRAQLSVVSQARVGVQREMGAVDSQIVLDEGLDALVASTGPGMGFAPKQAVMHEEQIGLSVDRHPDRSQAGIDCGCDPGDASGVFDLESVDSAVPVLESVGLQQPVAKPGHRGQIASRHAAWNRGWGVNARPQSGGRVQFFDDSY